MPIRQTCFFGKSALSSKIQLFSAPLPEIRYSRRIGSNPAQTLATHTNPPADDLGAFRYEWESRASRQIQDIYQMTLGRHSKNAPPPIPRPPESRPLFTQNVRYRWLFQSEVKGAWLDLPIFPKCAFQRKPIRRKYICDSYRRLSYGADYALLPYSEIIMTFGDIQTTW